MSDQITVFHGLTKMPFSKIIGTSYLFHCASHNELIARLEMALKTDDLALVTGISGSGKSTALRRFIDSLDQVTHPWVYLTAERYRIGELCKQILHGLKITPPFHGYAALARLKQEIEKRHREKNAKPVIVIDEAQELPLETLMSLKNITNYEMDSQSKLLIVLCGQIELGATLGMSRLESLARRIRIRYQVVYLSLEETIRYIEHQLTHCGSRKAVFTEDAIARIFSVTQGNISLINNICFSALILAASDSQLIIGPAIIEKVENGL